MGRPVPRPTQGHRDKPRRHLDSPCPLCPPFPLSDIPHSATRYDAAHDADIKALASPPAASVVLNWCRAASYPILDFRALWTLGIDRLPYYDFPLWRACTDNCQALAATAGVTMRELDRTLC